MNDKLNEPVAEIVTKNTFGYDVYEAELIEAGVNLPKGTKLYAHPADVDALKAENAALREALKPFAAYAAHYPLKRTFGNRPNTGEWHNVESGGIGRAQIDVEDFHRAAELLKEKP